VELDVRQLAVGDPVREPGHDRTVAEELLVALDGVLRLEELQSIAELKESLAVAVTEGPGGFDLTTEAFQRRFRIVYHRFNHTYKLWGCKLLVIHSPSAFLIRSRRGSRPRSGTTRCELRETESMFRKRFIELLYSLNTRSWSTSG